VDVDGGLYVFWGAREITDRVGKKINGGKWGRRSKTPNVSVKKSLSADGRSELTAFPPSRAKNT